VKNLSKKLADDALSPSISTNPSIISFLFWFGKFSISTLYDNLLLEFISVESLLFLHFLKLKLKKNKIESHGEFPPKHKA
jgi:hypothetical protein